MTDDEPLPRLFTLDAHGFPLAEPVAELWMDWWRRLENRRIAYTQLDNGMEVSTLFLGIDRGDGLMFETVVWRGNEIVTDEMYDARADALLGHQKLCERCETMGKQCG